MLEHKNVFLTALPSSFRVWLLAVKGVTGTLSKADVVAFTFNPSTQAAETGRSKSYFQVSLVYVVNYRPVKATQ